MRTYRLLSVTFCAVLFTPGLPDVMSASTSGRSSQKGTVKESASALGWVAIPPLRTVTPERE